MQQIKIFGLICDLLYKLEYAKLDSDVHFFSFSSKITFFDKYAISFRNFFFFGKIFRIRLIQIVEFDDVHLFCVLDQKYSFEKNSSQIIKIFISFCLSCLI